MFVIIVIVCDSFRPRFGVLYIMTVNSARVFQSYRYVLRRVEMHSTFETTMNGSDPMPSQNSVT